MNKAKKMFFKWVLGIAFALSIVYGLFSAFRQDEKQISWNSFSIQGAEHIPVGTSHPEYNSNPPTSGWHYAEEAEWGAHQEELPDERLIHNLEHGGIWIAYKGIDDATKTALEKIARSHSKVVVEPRSKNDAPIAVSSWGKQQKFQILDESALLNFIKANSNKSPEPFAQ
ncbi:DUF3105 domain-containing protein [Candidatus Azambacteria bacterium]|nr:DUF3105 domain-containing protein [Candidatus Azambacteria bacterium]